jgi:hypothetical protein
MQNVEMLKTTVLERLRENRKKHEERQKKALAVWNQKVIERLRAVLKKVESGKNYDEIYTQFSDLTKPIDVLKMDIRENITLVASEFNQYMLDRWHWQDTWTTSNSQYLGKR